MNRAVSLTLLQQWALTRLTECHLAAQVMQPPFSDGEKRKASWIALDATNTWVQFLRGYYLTSATAGWSSQGKVVGSQQFRRYNAALTYAVHYFRPGLPIPANGVWSHRDEPNWTDPATVSALLQSLGLSNENGFRLAMGAGSGSHTLIRTYRNFLAHRCRDTALKVRALAPRLGVSGLLDPIEVPFQYAPRRPQSVICDWLDEMWAIAALVPA